MMDWLALRTKVRAHSNGGFKVPPPARLSTSVSSSWNVPSSLCSGLDGVGTLERRDLLCLGDCADFRGAGNLSSAAPPLSGHDRVTVGAGRLPLPRSAAASSSGVGGGCDGGGGIGAGGVGSPALGLWTSRWTYDWSWS